jgi:hypothetical protein
VEFFIADGNGSFPVFGAEHQLSDIPINDQDIEEVGISVIGEAFHRAKCSAAWSSGCDWYMAIMPQGIVVMNIHSGIGQFCSKLSWRFVEAFADHPKTARRRTRSKSDLTRQPLIEK